MNIPIYRAKKIDSDEWVEGYLLKSEISNSFYIIFFDKRLDVMIHVVVDTNTLAIHFPNMIDKNGKKIFASLNNIGGDFVSDKYDNKYLVDFRYGAFVLVHEPKTRADIEDESPFDYLHDFELNELEVIGIHKG